MTVKEKLIEYLRIDSKGELDFKKGDFNNMKLRGASLTVKQLNQIKK